MMQPGWLIKALGGGGGVVSGLGSGGDGKFLGAFLGFLPKFALVFKDGI